MLPRPPRPTLFPYTTLFRSLGAQSFNGIPEITNRSFKGNITAREGEPSVIGGSVTDQELRSTQGYPGISQLPLLRDRKSTRLNSSHPSISYAVFCLKKKTAT